MILVTGATGLLGSHLLYHLVSQGYEVAGLFRSAKSIFKTRQIFDLYDNNSLSKFEKIDWRQCDILDYNELSECFTNIDEVYNCAGYVSFGSSAKEREQLIDVNIYGTRNIVNLALENKIKKFCHVSTIATLGKNSDNSEIDESSDFVYSDTTSYYTRSKFDGEMEVWRGITEGLQAVIVNPSVILGCGCWETNFTTTLFNLVGKGLKYYTSGASAFVYIEDLCNAMMKLMEQSKFGEKYIISNGNFDYKELLDIIADAMGKQKPNKQASAWLIGIIAILQKIFSKHPIPINNFKSMIANQTKYSNKKILEFDKNIFTDKKEFITKIAAQHIEYQRKN